ncbi:MAG: 5-oxoprolinase subunit PxpB [Dehalococcoidia bacterium]|nr:5-oxoprolinase subunit PxpB [Dehalococcoidia bacterium]
MIYEEPRFLTGGDRAIFVEFGDAIDPQINRRVRHLMLSLQRERVGGIVEIVPSYRSLLVYFEPQQIDRSKLRQTLHLLAQQTREEGLPKPRLIEIPTVYGGEYGPDLEFVAEHNNLSLPQVIQIHTGTPYLVYMIGFLPGFPYLGGMSPKIATPRLETPRTKVPAGSVGIAGIQTGIYPAESPGGWQLIGRTPLKLFDPSREPPALFQTGDCLSFVSITPEECNSIKDAVEQQTYLVKQTFME